MKFNIKFQIEAEPHPTSSGMLRVKKGKGHEFFNDSNVFRPEYAKRHMKPADCESLDLVDPDRNERLSK